MPEVDCRIEPYILDSKFSAFPFAKMVLHLRETQLS